MSTFSRPLPLASAIFAALLVLAPSVAMAVNADEDPRLARYREIWAQVTPKNVDIHAAAFEGCAGCEPYLVYCTRAIRSLRDLKGLTVRARNEAGTFFERHTGKVSVLLPAGEIGPAMQYGIIDCVGFGGERLEAGGVQVTAPAPSAAAPPAAAGGSPGGSDDFSGF